MVQIARNLHAIPTAELSAVAIVEHYAGIYYHNIMLWHMHVTGPGETDLISISVILSNTSFSLIDISHELHSSSISHYTFNRTKNQLSEKADLAIYSCFACMKRMVTSVH